MIDSSDVYVRYARLVKVVDGDTVDLDVDLGWKLRQIVRFRLLGLDTPEMNSSSPDERMNARLSRDYVFQTLSSWGETDKGGLGEGHEFPLWVKSVKTGKYGRWLGTIGSRNPNQLFTLNELLLSSGYAKPYLS